jgi:hypothetical protein
MSSSIPRRILNRKVLAIEIAGTIFIILLGSALHFTYARSGNNSAVAFFSAASESVWEHLKLAFWPSIFWLLITMLPLRGKVNSFFGAKAAGTYTMVALIPVVFYSYTAFTGESILTVDITTFIVAVIIGQIVSYQLFKSRQISSVWEAVAVLAVIGLALAFIVFTFYPPHLDIFRDPTIGTYGI